MLSMGILYSELLWEKMVAKLVTLIIYLALFLQIKIYFKSLLMFKFLLYWMKVILQNWNIKFYTIYRDLLKLFTTMELMRWATLVEDYGVELRKGSLESPATDVFGYTEEGDKRWKDLKNRVVEHVRIWNDKDDNSKVKFSEFEHKFLCLIIK